MTNTLRPSLILAAALSLGAILAASAQATPLSNCYDRVIAACNKLPDHAVNSCVNSGLDQCDGQFKASGGGSASEIAKLRAGAMTKIKTAPAQKR